MPNKSTAGVIAIIIGFLLLSASFVSAATIDDLKASIAQKNAELEQIQKEIDAYQKQIDETGKAADSLKKAIAQLTNIKNKLLSDIRATQKKIDIANVNIKKLSTDIDDKKKRLQRSLAALGASLRSVNDLEENSLVEILLSNQKFSDVWDDIDNLGTVQKNLKEHIEEVGEIKKDLEADKAKTEAEKKKLVNLKTGLSDQQKIVQNNQKEKDWLLKETKNKEAEYQRMLGERLEKKLELEQEILEFESKINLTVDVSKLPRVGSGVLSWPLNKIKITQYFGNTPFASKNPQVYNGGGHNGVDFRASVGTPVKAALSGRVVDTGNTDTACYGVSYGKWVLIEHGNGLSTLYAHLDLIKAGPGDNVSTGDVIGYSGNTGYTTGPHLHFTVFAAQAVRVSGPSEYRSKTCGTYLKLPISPRGGYLNPLSYL